MRKDGRFASQARPVRYVPNFTKNALGSVLIEQGNTVVLCTITCDDGVPGWMRSERHQRGWLTAEYCMLPSATHTRNKRERGFTSGRSQEIQRLIGRSLRGVVDLSKCPDMTFNVDCDVLQADGGTRTTAITGGWVALKIAIDKLLRSGRLKQNPLVENVSAISVGVASGEVLVDLDYEEDSSVDVDMNFVITQSGKILELQGTAEGCGLDPETLPKMVEAARGAIQPSFELQQLAADGQEVEG
ncbi:MAG: ribonuclease PH [Zetaproteobacteria bacterium]|nr:ribonuclease PH [Pseudobdellovibrionaceae bacterium]